MFLHVKLPICTGPAWKQRPKSSHTESRSVPSGESYGGWDDDNDVATAFQSVKFQNDPKHITISLNFSSFFFCILSKESIPASIQTSATEMLLI